MQFANNLTCRTCKVDGSVEDEDHILICPELTDGRTDIQFTDVFGDVNAQYSAVQVFKNVIRKRNLYLEKLENA